MGERLPHEHEAWARQLIDSPNDGCGWARVGPALLAEIDALRAITNALTRGLAAEAHALRAERDEARQALARICRGVPDVSTLRTWIDAYDNDGPEAIADARELMDR